YKGRIMEVAETEELFKYPLHPYTHSLMSAIPIPDPILEKKKKLFIYNPREYDPNGDQPKLVDIGNGHFVYGDSEEIAQYKKIRFGE
ncbi:MAG: peptide ABC transporter ATP-binding protein, partial [Clostridia bacterium]|nr:peptide ABC transporter ATP-binding protein [Clostridia bacterium]